MIKFLPSFVGSKSYWVNQLSDYQGCNIIELFAGSAVLSANLAKNAILNDNDIYLYKFYSNFLDLPVIPVFTEDDYFKSRPLSNWYMFLYYLQKMSFSGVYRWSKNGYNVPIKKGLGSVSIVDNLQDAQLRFKQLSPQVHCLPYNEVDLPDLSQWVVVLDPPYEKSQASYNKSTFDYHVYWEFVNKIMKVAKATIIFDSLDNMPFGDVKMRKMVVNGKHKGGVEAMFNFEKQKEQGQAGERIFGEYSNNRWRRLDGYTADFEEVSTQNRMELKTDLYDMSKTPNFFMERWSNTAKQTDGGPWQALKNKCRYYTYFFVKNKTYFMFETKQLVAMLDSIVSSLKLIPVMNSTYITTGYKVNRTLLCSIMVESGKFDETND